MKQKVIFAVAALVIAIGLLVLFGYYLSESGVQGPGDTAANPVDVKTPRIDGKLTYPVTVTDSKGHELTLERPPKRIVVTSSEAANCLIFLGKAEYIIGRLSHQKQPEIAHAKVVAGGSLESSYEALAAMKPDLLLVNLMNYEQKARMYEKYNLKYFAFDIKTISEMETMYGFFAKLLDADPARLEELKALLGKLDRVKERMEGLKPEERPKVFFEIGYRPVPRTVAADSIAADIIRRAGGRMFPIGRAFNAPISVESLMNDPPDWYLVGQGFLAGETSPEEVKKRPMLGKLRCIEENRFLLVDSLSYIQCHPRTVDNIVELAKKLHPDRMRGFD